MASPLFAFTIRNGKKYDAAARVTWGMPTNPLKWRERDD
jgi:hypothetical protein